MLELNQQSGCVLTMSLFGVGGVGGGGGQLQDDNLVLFVHPPFSPNCRQSLSLTRSLFCAGRQQRSAA